MSGATACPPGLDGGLMTNQGRDNPPDPRIRRMTVARVREVAGRDTDVMFFESARIYTLRKDHPGYDAAARLLRDAQAVGRPVRVHLATPHGDVIESLEDSGP
jgi:hypothetical protein